MGIDYRVRQGYCMNFTLQLFLFGIHTPWTIINSKQIGPHSTTVHQEHSILKVDFFIRLTPFAQQELSEASKIPGCVFVHTTGFIGGNLTKAGALEMATKTMEAETCAA